MTYAQRMAIGCLIIVSLGAASAWCGAKSVHASSDLTTMRLQMLVAEAGWTVRPDHAAMLHAIGRLASRHGRTVEDTMRRHVSEFHNGFPARRRWIGKLTTACVEPAGWPGHKWADTHQRLCFGLVRHVRLFEAGKLKDPCRGSPDQWRSRRHPKLQRRAARKGWRRIACGRDTLHVFYNSARRQT